jgi:chromosomal replication initiator protein
MNYIAIAGLKYLDEAINSPEVKAEKIISLVEQRFNIVPGRIRESTRKREVVYSRQIAMYLIHRTTSLSLKSIGLLFNGRDHTTVIHSNQTVKDLMYCYEYVREDISELMAQI